MMCDDTVGFKNTHLDDMRIEASNKGALSESEMTLWIVIGVIAAITIAAIVVISVILCKKKSHSSPAFKRKHGAESYKAVANGNSHSKKRSNKEDYWIKQDQLELEPCVKSDETVSSTIPRNADEMKPLDTPLQSRKDQSILEQENEKNTELKEKSPKSFLESPPYRHGEDYQPLPVVDPQDNMTVRMSPFTTEKRSSFPSPPESLNGNEGPSSDYGSEEIVSPKCNEPSVSYLPEGKANGDLSYYSYGDSNLENLVRDLNTIVAKEDEV
ncbi:uncharacterized protein LOC124451877 [Xenia sp. Carnegie-2017]|uniref:uncharacterized protein LOC124451877 n=1 Tax=Xenia sp. Carnegie-2017 TaxID=2897299 RepID=UPI001F049BFE|nr:uncharacterized protein LOC124451877 [Xenia sp. Carnegie-2017]